MQLLQKMSLFFCSLRPAYGYSCIGTGACFEMGVVIRHGLRNVLVAFAGLSSAIILAVQFGEG